MLIRIFWQIPSISFTFAAISVPECSGLKGKPVKFQCYPRSCKTSFHSEKGNS